MAKSTKAVKIRTALSCVKIFSRECFSTDRAKFNAARTAPHPLERGRTFRFFYTVSALICRALPRPLPCCRWSDAVLLQYEFSRPLRCFGWFLCQFLGD